MTEFYFKVNFDDINPENGSRESDLVIRAISSLYPEAVWERFKGGWKIVA